MGLECNAVFKGGGAKGIAYAGALEACERWEIDFKEVAGSSAGAITATLVACGYDAADVIKRMPIALRTIDGVASSMALVGRRASLLSSEHLHDWLARTIADRVVPGYEQHPDYDGTPPECTFNQLLEKTDISLYVVTLDLATRQPLVFCPQLTPNSPVAPAVVASSAIPVAFPPARMTVDGEVHRLVDGGTWSNYPSFVFLDKDFRHSLGPEPTDEAEGTERPTIGFILDPDKPAPAAPGLSPSPVHGAPLISDRGSSADELKLTGAIISSTLFRTAIGLAPILFVLLSLFWIAEELRGTDPLIGKAPLELQDLAMIGAVVVLAITGVAATVLSFVVLRLGKSLFDTGVVGASAAMGVGPGVPYWVGARTIGPAFETPGSGHIREHVAVRIDVPSDLSTLAFGAPDDVQEMARQRGRERTEIELERVFGPPKRPYSADAPAIASPSRRAIGRPTRSKKRRAANTPFGVLGWVFTQIAHYIGKLLRWTAGKMIPRFIALTYVLIVGTAASFNVVVGFASGETWATVLWVGVVGTAAVVGIWLVASMRQVEATPTGKPYRYLGRLKKWPIVLRILSVTAFALAIFTVWNELSFNNVSFFTAIRAQELSGQVAEVEVLNPDDPVDEAQYLVVIDVPLDQDDDDAFFTFLDIVDPFDEESRREFTDLVGADVGYVVSENEETLTWGFISVNEVAVGDPAVVRVDLEESLAYIEADLEEDLGAVIQLQSLILVGLGLLTFSFRAMRAAQWASQIKRAARLNPDMATSA